MMNQQDSTLSPLLIALWVIIACLGRAVPHPANVTPLMSLSVIAGVRFSRPLACLMVLVSMFVSDILVSLVYGYAPFGSWVWFTYTGFVGIVLLMPYLCRQLKLQSLLTTVCFSALAFWVWTNFGAWLLGGMYSKTMAGLGACYIAGLPFLRNALLGDLLWMLVIVGLLKFSVSRLFSQRKVVKTYE